MCVMTFYGAAIDSNEAEPRIVLLKAISTGRQSGKGCVIQKAMLDRSGPIFHGLHGMNFHVDSHSRFSPSPLL